MCLAGVLYGPKGHDNLTPRIGATTMDQIALGSPGTGRAKLRLSRGFPRRTRLRRHPPLN
jgi:hypothetical protein